MAGERDAGRGRRRYVPVWPVVVVVVLAFGIWGFLDLVPVGPTPDRLPVVDAIYRTLRLFVVDLEVPPGTQPPWQLWVAAFAAPAVTLRGIARLFREQVDGIVTRWLVRPRLVVFGANERSAALVAASGPRGRWWGAVVVVDPDPRALAGVTAARVRTVRGDGASVGSLRRAAVPKATYLVVVTGDNARNSAIATAVLDLPRATALEVYVEVEEPGLARTLEQGGRRVGVETIPFSAAALAAAAVLDQLEDERRAAAEPPLLAADRSGAGPALALFGTGDLVDAVVLELHRRRQVQLLEDPDAAGSVPRVVLFGPDADRRRRSLVTLVGTELRLLDLDAFDVELDQVVELDVETARHLARSRPLREVFVLTPTDLDGGGIAVTLARHLGRSAQIVLVTESGSSPFGDEIDQQSAQSPTLATVRLFRVPDHAYSLPTLRAERVADRLGRAMWESDRPAGDWDALSETDRCRYRQQARQRVEAAGAGTVPLRRSALVAPRPAEVPLLAALGFDRPTALARAGLGVDFDSVAVLELAGRRLLDSGREEAFGAWCELARLQTDPAALAAATPDGPGEDRRDVRDLLALRLATLGAAAHAQLAATSASADPVGSILLVGGAGDHPELALPLLEPTLAGVPADTVAAVLPPGPLRDALAAAGVRVADGSTRRQALDRWAAIVAAGREPADVRVAALPGAGAPDVLLARALGATLGRLEAPGAPDLSRLLLGGATGVVPLPPDRMTVRAFLRPARWPAELAELREPLAAELHRRYVARQRQRKQADDPGLQPWSVLSPWLRRSNLAVVDDIPNKLTLLGLRLAGPDELGPGLPAAELARRIAADMPLLAELEHGRFTAERLLAGWTGGVRDPARFMSPHLLPWPELDEQAKEWDREVVADLSDILAGQDVRVVPVRQVSVVDD